MSATLRRLVFSLLIFIIVTLIHLNCSSGKALSFQHLNDPVIIDDNLDFQIIKFNNIIGRINRDGAPQQQLQQDPGSKISQFDSNEKTEEMFANDILQSVNSNDRDTFHLFGKNSKLPPSLSCPCQSQKQCDPITGKPRKEIFIFSVTNNSKHWEHYDWNQITTVVMFNFYNSELMCLAHYHGARAVMKVDFPLVNVTNVTERDKFVIRTVNMVKSFHLDGVNFDVEDPVDKSDYDKINGLTALVKKTTSALKTINMDYQVTFDAAWQPDCVDNRCYDMFEISSVTDYLFVMSYDEQSQMTDPICHAQANAGFDQTVTGLLQYVQMNIPKEKLILGVPWYGYDYPCLSLSLKDECTIKSVPFRGAKCSDAAGVQKSFANITHLLLQEHLIRHWDNVTKSPFINYKDSSGVFHQIWYDDVKSLSLKYAFAVKFGLGGVGMWNADSLNYSAPEDVLFKSMWKALPKFS